MAWRIALCGAAHPHLRDVLQAIRQAPDVTLAGVWDHDAARAGAVAEAAGVEIRDPADPAVRPDGVVVLSETRRHAGDIRRLLPLGVPLFVEKPFALAEEAEGLAATIAASGVPFHTGHFLRETPGFRALQDRLAGGRLGRVLTARVRFRHDGLLAGWIDPGDWIAQPDESGMGGFGDLGLHALDLLHWLGLGPLSVRSATLVRLTGRTGCDDHGVAVLAGRDGLIASVEAGWAAPPGGAGFAFELTTEAASVDLSEGQLRLSGAEGPQQLGAVEAAPILALGPFLDTLRGGPPERLIAPEDALAAIRLTAEAYRR